MLPGPSRHKAAVGSDTVGAGSVLHTFGVTAARLLQGLLAGRDDIELMKRCGIRDINRHRFSVQEATESARRPVVQV